MRIGKVLADWRYANRLNLREAAPQLGLSVSALSRIENDKATDAATVLKLINWLFDPNPAEGPTKRAKPAKPEQT